MLLDDELAALFEDLESDRVERTISTTKKSKIAEAICAFANDLPRHDKLEVIFVGVSDNGQCANFELDSLPHGISALGNYAGGAVAERSRGV